MRFNPVIVAVCFILAVSVVQAQETLKIVTTTTQATDLTRILTEGVEEVQITPLMQAGVDPHLYQPTEANIRAMSEAKLIVYSGINLEGRFDAVFESLSQQGVRIVALSNPIVEEGFTLSTSYEGESIPDPHFWFDPRNWQLSTIALAEEIALLLPSNAELIRANAKAYNAQLDILYAWAVEAMRQAPEEQRFLVTSHDAFQYFGDAFGWEMVAIQGISTADEAGVGDIQGIVSFVNENNIPVLFVESSVSKNTIEAVREAVQSEGGTVGLGIRELYSDAMGNEDEFGGTYIGMIASNVIIILASYQEQGVELVIPAYPDDLMPALPDDLLSLFAEE